MNKWFNESIVYHIYPLGFCGAPKYNDFKSSPTPLIENVLKWTDHIKKLGADTIYFGPIFESTSHGYDTADYYNVDRRLGSNDTFKKVSLSLHKSGFRIILDGVFNHVGRDFWAFKDVLKSNQSSDYCSWFCNLRFGEKSPYGDPFNYDTWSGCYNLVKLNLKNNDVKNHIFGAVKKWIEEFDIDGLRLDAADNIDLDFLKELSHFCKSIKKDFFLVGEVIFGDYNRLANKDTLDSVTNYECYKGLYSSLNSKNYFEIAYSLNRQFNKDSGIYKNIPLYSFVDNHDVNRIGSTLINSEHLYNIYTLLFTMPGIPSIYYGSEWAIEGKKDNSDYALRPKIDLDNISKNSTHKDLPDFISKLAHIRSDSNALKYGIYEQIFVKSEQFGFIRKTDDESIITVLNASPDEFSIDLDVPESCSKLVDLLNSDESFDASNTKCRINIKPYGERIFKVINI